jgi:hypothetical protein
MTGKVADKIRLESSSLSKREKKDELWAKLLDFKRNQCMMGCSASGETEGFIQIEGENTGLLSGHAYSVLDVFELPYSKDVGQNGQKSQNYHQNHRLLRIRNPWGYGEWQLKWSENPDYREKVDSYMPLINEYY